MSSEIIGVIFADYFKLLGAVKVFLFFSLLPPAARGKAHGAWRFAHSKYPDP
jgi:hypothetical protein